MWGCHHESERDGKGKGGTKAGGQEREKGKGKQESYTATPKNRPIWPFVPTWSLVPTRYSRTSQQGLALFAVLFPALDSRHLMMRPMTYLVILYSSLSDVGAGVAQTPALRPSDGGNQLGLYGPGQT